jgi:hypothetical protein
LSASASWPVAYLRHLAALRPADASGLCVAASDLEALFHHDPSLNPEAIHQPAKAEHFETTRSSAPAMGCQEIATERGLVHVHDGPGLLTFQVERPDGNNSVAIMVYDPPEDGAAKGFGLVAQMDAPSARTIAASLLRLGDWLDGGRKPN